jgi:hypothetical protein
MHVNSILVEALSASGGQFMAATDAVRESLSDGSAVRA